MSSVGKIIGQTKVQVHLSSPGNVEFRLAYSAVGGGSGRIGDLKEVTLEGLHLEGTVAWLHRWRPSSSPSLRPQSREG